MRYSSKSQAQLWWANASRLELLSLAKDYPYNRPLKSFLFVCGNAYQLNEWNINSLMDGRVCLGTGDTITVYSLLKQLAVDMPLSLENRTPVLSYGSNGSPMQLRRKFRHLPQTVIPVITTEVADLDVVYSAHFSRYGAIPATLASSPGTTLLTSTTWLTANQLAVMHNTEMGGPHSSRNNYIYGMLPTTSAPSVASLGRDAVGVYISRFGALGLFEAPVALAAISSSRRIFHNYAMSDILNIAGRILAPDLSLNDFILKVIKHKSARHSWSEYFREAAIDTAIPEFAAL